jgi:hypothetical protein
MAPALFIKSIDEAAKNARNAAAQCVIDAFGNELPQARLLCFLDDHDWESFKQGKATRGFFVGTHPKTRFFEGAPAIG